MTRLLAYTLCRSFEVLIALGVLMAASAIEAITAF